MRGCHIWVLSLLLPTLAQAATVWHVAANGGVDTIAADGGRPGAKPFKTIAFALSQLRDGDELVVADGRYADLTMSCDGGHPASVNVHAEHERMADLTAATLNNCRGWHLEGLRFTSDVGINSAIVLLPNTSAITLRRNLLVGGGDIAWSQIDAFGTGHLIEENEFRGYARRGLLINSEATDARRNYFNAGPPSAQSRDAIAIDVQCGSCFVENNLSEGGLAGITTVNMTPVAPVIVGNLQRACDFAYLNGTVNLETLCTVIDSDVAIELSRGFSSGNVSATRVTAQVFAGVAMVDVTSRQTNVAPGFDRSAIEAQAIAEADSQVQVTSTVWLSDAGASVSPVPGGDATGVTRVSTSRQGCWVNPPTYWPWRLADGSPIGANLVNRTEKGAVVARALFSPGFPCGVSVPGINDAPDASCVDAHQRFGVNRPACPLGVVKHAPQFASVPGDEARCGEVWTYRPIVESSLPVTWQLDGDGGLTVAGDGTVTWVVDSAASGFSEATFTASSDAGSASQRLHVQVDCPPPTGCGCGSVGPVGFLGLLAMVRLRKRVA